MHTEHHSQLPSHLPANPAHAGGSAEDRPSFASGSRRLSWPLIAGLSALALLWPLAELTGMPSGGGRAAVILAITGVCWIGVVGLGRFPRPVLTLTLVGLGSGILAHALGLVFGAGAGPALWALPISLALQAGWGAIAGLLAWTLQLALGHRR